MLAAQPRTTDISADIQRISQTNCLGWGFVLTPAPEQQQQPEAGYEYVPHAAELDRVLQQVHKILLPITVQQHHAVPLTSLTLAGGHKCAEARPPTA